MVSAAFKFQCCTDTSELTLRKPMWLLEKSMALSYPLVEFGVF